MATTSHPHAINIEKNPNRVTVTFNGTLVADTQQALVLREGSLPPVSYIPREDVMMAYLNKTDHTTHCPFKGDASYFTVSVKGRVAENAVWSYETPFSSVSAITGYVVFYQNKMDAIEEHPLDG